VTCLHPQASYETIFCSHREHPVVSTSQVLHSKESIQLIKKETYCNMAVEKQNSLGGQEESARMFKTKYFQMYVFSKKRKKGLH